MKISSFFPKGTLHSLYHRQQAIDALVKDGKYSPNEIRAILNGKADDETVKEFIASLDKEEADR